MRQRLSIIISVFLILFMAYGSAIAESVLYYADATAADHGAAGTRTIKGLMTAIGATKEATIVLAHNSSSTNTTYTISTDLTLTSNITLNVDRGALASIANGKTLAINGQVDAGDYQIFSGTGTVSGLNKSNLVWFGGPANDASTDFVAALKAAVAATVEGGVLEIPSYGTTYYYYDNAAAGLTDATEVDKAMTIKLDGIIKQSGYAYQASPAAIFYVTGDNVTITGTGTLQGPGAYSNVNGTYSSIPCLILGSSAENLTIKDITIKDPPQSGINCWSCKHLDIANAKFTGGILVDDASVPGNFYIDLDGGENNSIHDNKFWMDSVSGSSRQAIFAGANVSSEQYLSVTNNKIYGMHSTALYCYSDYGVFTGNTIAYTQSDPDDVLGTAMKIIGIHNVIEGNDIYNAVEGGIRADGASGVVINGNTIYDYGSVGIVVGDQNANAVGLNNNIISNNIVIARTDGESVADGIRYAGDATLTTHDCSGGKIVNNTIINGGGSTYYYHAPISVVHYKTGATYKMNYFDISGNTIIDRKCRSGIFVENLHYSNISNNIIKDSNQAASMGIYFGNAFTGTNTFNKSINNVVRDDQGSPTLTAGVYYASTNSTDNNASGNKIYGESGTNPWGFSAANRNYVEDWQGTVTSKADAAPTLTIAEIMTRIITGAPTAARNYTLPTGTLMDGGIVDDAIGDYIDWTIINLSATHEITVVASTGHTIVGNAVVAVSTSAGFRSKKSAANTYITYRLR
jgi:hypothetical protein